MSRADVWNFVNLEDWWKHFMKADEYTNYELFVQDIKSSNYNEIRERLTTEQGIDLIHAMFGLASEPGEVADALKKHIFYGQELDVENVIEECGDIVWYLSVALNAVGSSLSEAISLNETKLRTRYPNGGFSKKDAAERKDKSSTL